MATKPTLSARVDCLETDMQSIIKNQSSMTAAHKTMETTLTSISDGQVEILAAIKTAKSIRIFARKFIWPVITAAATAGFLNPKVSAFLTALFA